MDGITMPPATGRARRSPSPRTRPTRPTGCWSNTHPRPVRRASTGCRPGSQQCLPPPPSRGGPAEAGGGKGNLLTCVDRLSAEGYRQQLVYQPASRFWALQWAETGLFVGLSALLAWFSLWWVRRRLT